MLDTSKIVGNDFSELSVDEMKFISGALDNSVASTPTVIASAALSYAISKDISSIFH
ncbi:MAG: lichenicidin A2 family type 2 lantibiotic [Candidatus Ancillula sp.]|jgi:type 2 lantibiotic (TIGR03893 family)|nr:lichenicidin A2 family type 2 lantibiotic [Candidatus Ancillula sp.]